MDKPTKTPVSRIWFLQIISGLVLFSVLIWFVLRDEPARVALMSLPFKWLAALVVMQVCYLVLDALRYHKVLPVSVPAVPLTRWLGVFSVGRLINSAVPQAGTAYRMLFLRRHHGIEIAGYVAPMVGLTWLGVAIALIGIGAVLSFNGAAPGIALSYTLLGALGVSALLLIGSRVRKSRREDRQFAGGRLRSIVVEAAAGARSVAQRGIGLQVLTLSVLVQSIGVLIWVVTVSMLGVPDAVVVGAILYLSSTAATVVTITPGSLGVAEMAAAIVGEAVLDDFAPAVLSAVVVRMTGLGATGLLALAFGRQSARGEVA